MNYIAGFKPNLFSEALGLGVKVKARDPVETFTILDTALGAVERAVRQMPDDKLDWRVPGRDRPMSEFAYHIFDEAHTRTRTLETGEIPPRTHEQGRLYKSFAAIADYGHGIVEEYREWVPEQDVEPLRRHTANGEDELTAVERLDLITGHTIQHLRQLYALLEQFGVTPDDRLQDDDLPSEFVLETLW